MRIQPHTQQVQKAQYLFTDPDRQRMYCITRTVFVNKATKLKSRVKISVLVCSYLMYSCPNGLQSVSIFSTLSGA